MEKELVSGESEAQALREEVQGLNAQAEAREDQHQSVIQKFSTQLENARSSIVS